MIKNVFIKKSFKVGILISLSVSSLIATDWDSIEAEATTVKSETIKKNYNPKEEKAVMSKKKDTNKVDNSNGVVGEDYFNEKDMEEVKEVKKEKLPPLVKLKNYSGVRYIKNKEKYSIVGHSKRDFYSIKQELKMPEELIKKMYGRANTTVAKTLNAYYIDYKLKKPNIAENFYRMFDKTRLKHIDKLRYADFLIRTGRSKKVLKIMSFKDCERAGRYKYYFYYYRGLAKYLTKGIHSSEELRRAKPMISMAAKIYRY